LKEAELAVRFQAVVGSGLGGKELKTAGVHT